MTLKLQDKVAVITGCGRGIGLAIAQRYASEGAKVVVSDINASNAEAGAKSIRDAGGEAVSFAGDAGLAADVDALFALTSETFGPVDILVNNAAITTDQRHFFDGDEEWWDTYLRVNLKSQYLGIDRAARIMAKNSGGAIVNLSSGGGTRAHRGRWLTTRRRAVRKR